LVSERNVALSLNVTDVSDERIEVLLKIAASWDLQLTNSRHEKLKSCRLRVLSVF
jgi:hypothetical protein